MAERAKHAFGTLENIDSALSKGTIDAYDILFVKDANGKPYVGWIDKEGNKVICQEEEKVIVVEGNTLPEAGVEGKIYIFGEDGYFWNGTEFVNLCKPTDLTKLESEVAEKADANEVENSYERIKYEITSVPTGTLVDYSDKEIRVMCPADTKWVKQSVGSTGNANYYYMGFKAYAPEGAVGFKEGDKGVIVDEYFDFSGDFAGTDEFGRNYSICWLALAMYDEATDNWTYFGKNSSIQKYVGFDYIVDWYDANGVVIESGCVRINLSNETCHSVTIPYYVGAMEKKIEEKFEKKITDIETKIEESESAIEIVEF